MIKQIKIENFKSIPSLELDLGRVNVFVGENGCGKTNILEAIGLGCAAADDKLDNEFLVDRGIRAVDSNSMISGFLKSATNKEIVIGINSHDFCIETQEHLLNSRLKGVISTTSTKISSVDILTSTLTDFVVQINEISKKVEELQEKMKNDGVAQQKHISELDRYKNELDQKTEEFKKYRLKAENLVKELNPVLDHFKTLEKIGFIDYRIFCPENTHLRRFDEEGQIRPLGIRGEGLFSHLADLARKEPKIFQKINETLQLIDWVEGFEIPNDLIFNERRIRIRDRYLDEGIQYIDQRSSNEGFLYLLFYVTLFISPYTPKFFAIDNIDNALNPRLCAKLIAELVRLAKENDKQVIVTAHNPGLLDGLNLNDEEQRLFVISRNKLGHTKALRIEHKPSSNGHEPVKLSEQFLRGYIGGIPNI